MGVSLATAAFRAMAGPQKFETSPEMPFTAGSVTMPRL